MAVRILARRTIAAAAVSGVLLGGAGLGAVAAQAAVPAAPAASAAGSYVATISSGTSSFKDPLVLKVTAGSTTAGTFSFEGGPKGTWTETGTALSMKGTLAGTKYSFAIVQQGKNLGSKKNPGTLTSKKLTATWYAIAG